MTFKASCLSVVMTNFKFGDITSYMLNIITSPHDYEESETMYISFVDLNIDKKSLLNRFRCFIANQSLHSSVTFENIVRPNFTKYIFSVFKIASRTSID